MGIAYIGKVTEIHQIENADRLESAVVVCGKGGKWWGVVLKNQFSVGDMVEVYLQDALLPHEERFAFMESRKWRVRIQTFRGARSECFIMPLLTRGDAGDEIACEKYEKTLPASMSKVVRGDFPTHLVPKTDELHFQKVKDVLNAMHGETVCVTQKCDGSSTTFYTYDEHFGVCSRNLELKYTEQNTQWQMARKYNIEAALRTLGFNAALQVEAIGPGIQKNPMGIANSEIRAFDLYNIDERRYMGQVDLTYFCDLHGIPKVRTLSVMALDSDEEKLLSLAGGWMYPNGKPQEGIVVRPMLENNLPDGQRYSFKVINPAYKD